MNTKHVVLLHPKKYGEDILSNFWMNNCNPTITQMEDNIKQKKESDEELVDITFYKQIIGLLRYLCNTIPYIRHNVVFVSRFLEEPRICHLLVAKRIMRYNRDTTNHGIVIQY